MLPRCRLVAVVLLSSLAAAAAVNYTDKRVDIIIPWVERGSDGYFVGSSFLIAMKRYNYNVPFALMAVSCHDQLSLSSNLLQVFSPPGPDLAGGRPGAQPNYGVDLCNRGVARSA